MGPKAMLEELKKARQAATFEDARFGTFGKEADEETAHIREETQLYRDTWILPRLDRVISALERKTARQNDKG